MIPDIETDAVAMPDHADLIDSFEGGDMGDVEFVELALEAGMDMDRIETVLARAKSDDF